jgi:hypothetical protein
LRIGNMMTAVLHHVADARNHKAAREIGLTSLPEQDPSESPPPEHRTWAQRRRDKVVEEIARNRRGEYTVPTWVLATILGVIVVGWVAVVVLAG